MAKLDFIYLHNLIKLFIFFLFCKVCYKKQALFSPNIQSYVPASTGKDNNNNTAVITTAQPNKANFVHKNDVKTLLKLLLSINNITIIYFNVVTLI